MGSFSRWVDDNERQHVADAPVAHYKFYYLSKIGSRHDEEPILLDILFTGNPYPKLIELPINHTWLQTNGDNKLKRTIPEAYFYWYQAIILFEKSINYPN